jgi:hypothetical protein
VRFIADGNGAKAISVALEESERQEQKIVEEISAMEECQKELYKAPPQEWVTHRLESIQDILEKETEDSALLLRRLLGPIILNPTTPEIGKSYYQISTNFNTVAMYPASPDFDSLGTLA